ncbi:deoxyribodipyrimidine photolyase [Stieleria maiorica]|uniref:Deoxyribodipyrimidine photo-lyase n=1 Tax=Stieleria maiorica TaxID=2795974 RepID=A0A5B9MH67_9BACT|nr:deoxyribodipyrimidine photo-lyase [Stieleria maiorica]QEF98974.1 deoxyribodipyrimidine photolyase [Stieleria maiorica]
MATQLIQSQRVKHLNDRDIREGDYVVYWMEQSQRAQCNHALEYAIRQANEHQQRLLVLFVIADQDDELTLRQATFMLEGLRQTQSEIQARGIKMVVRCGSPVDVVCNVGKNASLVVCDRGYLRHQKAWRKKVASEVSCHVVQVESDVIVPVDIVSDHQEYAARTIRPKLHSHLAEFLVELSTTPIEKDSMSLSVGGEELSDLNSVVEKIRVDRTVPAVSEFFQGGTSQANAQLKRFIGGTLKRYGEERDRPESETLSYMSMYLHFGQISPLAIALEIKNSSSGTQNDRDSYLEELVVRRELSQNFVNFTDDYDSYSCLPDWATETLQDHRDDQREHHYTRSELVDAQTHDKYWNAAMNEMRHTGYMHNHMRMYWGKQILAWTNTPEYAYRVALELNNRYFLDGRDANSFANVAWIFGNHDRAFGERPVFGKVRPMTHSGLERKSDPDQYVERVNQRCEQATRTD